MNKPNMHCLKILPDYFWDVVTGAKTFEIRYNDRGYKIGDLLQLEEYDPETKRYTNRYIVVEVTYMLESNEYMQDNYVCMSIVRRIDRGIAL